MKNNIKINKKRSSKSFLILVLVGTLSLIYIFNDKVSSTNHIDTVVYTISKPRENIQLISQNIQKDVNTTRRMSRDVVCLAQNIFFEGRNTDLHEKIRIVNVTLNRVKSGKYPASVCGVVYQDSQFSWTKQNKNLKRIIFSSRQEKNAWINSVAIAQYAINNNLPDLTNGSIYYHTHYVKPWWSSKKKKTIRSKWHQYYR